MQPLVLLDKFSSSDYDEARQKVAYMKATSLYKSGQFAEAIEYYTQAIKVHNNTYIIAASLYWKAQAYFELKEFTLAIETFYEVKKQGQIFGIAHGPFAQLSFRVCVLSTKELYIGDHRL